MQFIENIDDAIRTILSHLNIVYMLSTYIWCHFDLDCDAFSTLSQVRQISMNMAYVLSFVLSLCRCIIQMNLHRLASFNYSHGTYQFDTQKYEQNENRLKWSFMLIYKKKSFKLNWLLYNRRIVFLYNCSGNTKWTAQILKDTSVGQALPLDKVQVNLCNRNFPKTEQRKFEYAKWITCCLFWRN